MLKHNKYFYLLIYALLVIPIISLIFGGMYFLVLPFTIFIVIPAIDFIIHDPINPDSEETKNRIEQRFYHHILIAYLPIHILLIIGCMFYIFIYDIATWEVILLSIMIGIITGSIGINIAHELMHKSNVWDQIVSRVLLVMVCYGHFAIEHVQGHHVYVATKKDPATARLNETIYHFIPRVIWGSFISAWKIEKRRLLNHGLPIYHWKNEFYWIIGVPIVLSALAYVIAGWLGLLFFLLQSFIAILMLEVVNYIEHYGLLRPMMDNGRFEPMGTKYAWDADHWLSNHLLFNLMRHADHHTYGSKPYQVLLLSEDSPKLPASYAALYWIVLIPPLWFSIMNPKVHDHNKTIPKTHIAS